MSLAITAVSTTAFRLPMRGELRWGKHGRLRTLDHVLIQVRLTDGSTGLAEAPSRPTIYGETVASIESIVATELSPRLVGLPVEQAPAVLQEIKNNQTARGAIDMAIHDAVAQSRGLSLAEHLGCTQERLRVSYILGLGARDTMLAEAERVVAQGVRVLKVKVGLDWENDLAQIRDLRQMFGESVALYADANECFTPATASARLDSLCELGMLYCEEPLPIEYIRERAALRAVASIPLIADDSTFAPRDLVRELELDTFDILNIKTPRTGYTESRRMVEMARAAGKGILVGSQAGSGLGAARAAIFAALPGIEHPSELSFFLKLEDDIIEKPLQIRDGYLALADALAVQVDSQRLRAAHLAHGR